MKLTPYWIVLWVVAIPTVALAGPGGTIARAIGETFWGKIVVCALVVILSPLIAYVMIREGIAQRKAMKSLAKVGAMLPDFDWIKLRRRVDDCFRRVHAAWEKSDVSEASEWMTSWYWQNQQTVFLDKWEREGLENICAVQKINSTKPIMFSYRCENGIAGQGSEMAVVISARMTDYLVRKSDGKVVEGSKRPKDVERIWSFTYDAGRWLVSFIDEGSNTLQYVEMMKTVPPIESLLPETPKGQAVVSRL